MMSSNERFSVSSSFRLRIRFRNARSSAESFDGFLVRDIAVADLPLMSLIAQNKAPRLDLFDDRGGRYSSLGVRSHFVSAGAGREYLFSHSSRLNCAGASTT